MKLRVFGLIIGLFAVMSTPVRAATLTHVVILVKDMQAARRIFEAAGFKIEPSGPISPALMHAVMPFRDGTFLELIAACSHAKDVEDVYAFLRSGDGIEAAGFEVPNASVERKSLLARGFRVDPLAVSPHWIDIDFSEPAGILDPFFLYQYRDDIASRHLRKYAALAASQPYGAIGIRGIDVAVAPGVHAASTYAAVGLRGVTTIEQRIGAPSIVLVRVATSNLRRKGTTIVVDHCRIRFE